MSCSIVGNCISLHCISRGRSSSAVELIPADRITKFWACGMFRTSIELSDGSWRIAERFPGELCDLLKRLGVAVEISEENAISVGPCLMDTRMYRVVGNDEDPWRDYIDGLWVSCHPKDTPVLRGGNISCVVPDENDGGEV